MVTLHDLQVFPHLPLKGLIAAQGVCPRWKEFIAILNNPLFRDLDSRPWLWENLRPFNRQAYLDHILAQHNYIPEDFRLWILEWPNKATTWSLRVEGYNHLGRLDAPLYKIGVELQRICHPYHCSDGGWDYRTPLPNLSDFDYLGSDEEDSDDSSRTEVFRYSPPPGSGPDEVELPALLVWEKNGVRQTFLALSPDSPFAVYFIEFHGTYQDGIDRQYLTWIDWLCSQLRRMHRAADSKTPLVPDVPPKEPREDPILYDTWFRSLRNSTPLWTKEDEESLD
ncbi:hypothetical protein FB45DRAFT_1062968 [Roridomyces roridus]|uniref:F-box domain-containing protein n=1 Tax=Roridomyces roridus TaxID=1738132 RepID=A0AAD7BG09_9AGAR|nr:hypothetical protein FB45DRAFT_1062968 [Roridomyces roridus]